MNFVRLNHKRTSFTNCSFRCGFGRYINRWVNFQSAATKGIQFERFSLANMRPKAVTKRSHVNIKDATSQAGERMIDKTYDRRVVKESDATE